MKAAIVAAIVLSAAPTLADEDAVALPSEHQPRAWAGRARTSYVRMGPSTRPTGGMEITADAMRTWTRGGTSVSAGVEISACGFDAGLRWTSFLGGPAVEVWQRVSGAFGVGASVHVDAGRVPIVTRWGLPLNFSGVFPATFAGVRYEPSPLVRFELTGGPRWINTLAWAGAGFDAGFSGTVRF